MSSNYINICRVCMKEDENFTNLYSADTDFLEYHVKLFFCIPTVNIDNVKFPQKLCQCCIEDLRIAYKFKQTCLNSTFIINEILKNEEKKNRSDETVYREATDIIQKNTLENINKNTPENINKNTLDTINRNVKENIYKNSEDNIYNNGNNYRNADKIINRNLEDNHRNAGEVINRNVEEIINKNTLENIHHNAMENIRKYTDEDIHKTVMDDVENVRKTVDDIHKHMIEDPIDVIDTYKNDIEEHFEEDHTYFIKSTDTDLDEIVTSHEMETNVIIEEIHREIKKEVDEDDDSNLRENTFNPMYPTITDSKKRSSSLDYLYCSLCDIEFGEDDFNKHKYVHRKDSTIKCPKCDRYFVNPKQLKCFFKHYCIEKTHQKNLGCNACNRFFKSTQALANHKKVHNIGNDIYECQLCDLVFKSVQKLDWHYRNGVHVEKNTKKIKIYDNNDE